MTDEVADLVLADNYSQNEALSLARHLAPRLFGVHRRLMAELERAKRLDRALEFLPDDDTAAARAANGGSLTSPELSVLLAYVKIGLADDLLAGPVPDDAWCRPILRDYFPTPVRQGYARYAETHPLRREIITTAVVNDVVNHGGISFVFRTAEETGAGPADIVRAYAVIRDVFGLGEIWRAANRIEAAAQTAVMVQARRVLDRGVRWLLQSRSGTIDVEAEVARLRPGMAELAGQVGNLMIGREAARYREFADALTADGVPAPLAEDVTAALYGFGLLDVVELSHHTDLPAHEVAALYYTLSERFRVDEMLDRISALPRADRWQALARLALRYDLYGTLDSLTREVLRRVPGEMPADARVGQWAEANGGTITRVLTTLGQLAEDAPSDLATLTVLLRQINTVVRASSAANSMT
jgi:glutamate dehydrogenase